MKPNQGKTETVKVAVRVRPMNNLEKKNNSVNCIEVDKSNNQISATKPDSKESKTFQYDYVYDTDSNQRQIYDDVAFSLVEAVLEGYNGTIFAYGQTGCGKTFTMMGDYNSPDLRGIIPNAFAHIFGHIQNEENNKKFLVRCSFIEIYNEEIRDLLGKDSNKKLEIREDTKTGIYVKDMTMLQVKNKAEIETCLTTGHKSRHVGETTMNAESSRSHCIFTVHVEIGENMEDSKNKKIKAGKLNLVDLAGSERQSKTGATGNRLEEAKKINLSLTALSNVINALVENKQHVPYRDSKLTRLLQDSLGGNTKTVMIAAISPSSFNFDETVSTLRYAARANAIKNAPKINEDPKDALLRQYEEEIKRLKAFIEIEGGINQQNAANPANAINQVNTVSNIHKKDSELERKILNDLKEKEQIIACTNLEKEKLMQRLLEMEKELNKKLINGGQEIDEREKKKFKEYKEKQKRIKEEDEKKHELLEAKKKEEEESTKNDINKLRHKVKYLESEIRDLRYENERDKEDMIDTIKALNKENKLYMGLLRIILSESEIKKLSELSKWNEDNEEWRIQPYSFREKKIQLPNIKPHQVNEFVENEINSRDLNIEEHSIIKNNKQKLSNKDQIMMRSKYHNFNESHVENFHKLKSNEINNIITNNNIFNQNQVHEHNLNKKQNNINSNNQNANMYVINRKEAKKFEEMLKNSQNINYNKEIQNMLNQQNPHQNTKMKVGKIYLDPINNNSSMNQTKINFNPGNKKMEVSFKATLQFTDDRGNNNKIEINNPNIVNLNNSSIHHNNSKHNSKKKRINSFEEH